MNGGPRAVFLSYASQDADAARRVCDALCGAGIEVWLDQSELVGGDAWDAKIRGQIGSCMLFVPIISANTQSRREGYFRLEWKLAVQRTHMMSERTAFLLPVVIDDTRDADADVPAEFRAVQWTRLNDGAPSAQFIERVKTLLGADPGARSHNGPTPPSSSAGGTSAVPGKLPRRRLGYAMVLLAVAIAATIWLRPRQAHPTASANPEPKTQNPNRMDSGSAKSIAVLPFANLSEDKDVNAFFSDGMHEELLSALAKISDMRVISRTSVLTYRDATHRNVRQIAAELGVAHILEGSVSRSGRSVRIIVKLIDAATDGQRWNETYNLKEVIDVFQVQADIAARIAQSLAATISPGEKRALAQKLTSDSAAYDLYLRGRRWREIGRRELSSTALWEERIVRPLEEAVARDPRFAAAYAELGHVHGELYWWRFLDPSAERLARAKVAIDTALRLDPALPAAHLALGTYYYRLLDYERATEAYAVALAAMPGDTEVLFYLASAQRRQGRWREAAANMERAFWADPRHRTYGDAWVGQLLAQRLYRQAETAADRVLAMNPVSRDLLIRQGAQARFARDGDVARYRAVLAEARDPDTSARFVDFQEAFFDRRYADAVRIYDDAPDEMVSGYDNRRSRNERALYEYLFAANAVGHREKARARALAGIVETDTAAEDRRNAWVRVARLAMLNVYAGNPAEARRLADRTLELMPLQRDALDGMRALNEIARVHLALGDHDPALALLDQAMSVPNEISANEILHFHPWWKPLHQDPRFKAALAKAAPKD